jgi:hypothetical protein
VTPSIRDFIDPDAAGCGAAEVCAKTDCDTSTAAAANAAAANCFVKSSLLGFQAPTRVVMFH